ncbi:MAG: glycosyltransferase [Candidatus Omnitrophica bacterium]|nr:glycosyltransferase [Candidatus Omnitrophota bacterium]
MHPVCDLVLLSWNHLEETRPCLQTLFASTTVPSRLLIVDNASEPPVRQFLAGVTPQGAIREVVLLQNETNEGFSAGMNRGIRASGASYVCLLNNDLRFAPGWLEELLAVAAADPAIGLVNPSSSTFGDRPSSGEPVEVFALRRSHLRGRYTEVGMGIGFCLLIKREVLQQLQGLTEEVDRAFFEDEDFSIRAQQAGWRCVVAEGAYVYHVEHQSVRDVPQREALFARNQRWCHRKWGKWVRIAWPCFEVPAPGSDALRRWLERLIEWARRRTHLYVYCPLPDGLTGEVLFRSVGLIPHADILWLRVPEGIASWAVLWRILLRRKKRFDIIVAPDPAWGQLAAGLSWLHRAPVVPQQDEERLTKQWQRSRLVS